MEYTATEPNFVTASSAASVTCEGFGWSREFSYVLSACRQSISEDDTDKNVGSLDVDWNRVLELAAAHRVLPQLHRRLVSDTNATCPLNVREAVKSRVRLWLHRSLFLSGELVRIVVQLEHAGVNSLTFKGPSLSKLVYGDISSRTFDDIDILVSENDFLTTSKCLADLGYKSYENLTLDQQLFQMRSKGEILFGSPSGGLVDLHTSLSRGSDAYQVSWNELWNRRQVVDVENAQLATFGANDLFLYLAIHGAKHRWSRLNWILDFARSIRHGDCKQTLSSANLIGERKVFQLAMQVCEATLGVTDARAEIAGELDGNQACLLKELEQNLESGVAPNGRLSGLIYLFRARQRPMAAILALFAEITTPHLTDWNAIRLPRVLWFCYVFIRPIRLIWKRLRS